MTRVRQAARRDGNHKEIVRTVRSLGATWFDTADIPEELDGVLGCAGIDQRCEIKNPNAERGAAQALKLTEAEQKVFDEWGGRTPVILQTVDDVINLVNKLRKESSLKKSLSTTQKQYRMSTATKAFISSSTKPA